MDENRKLTRREFIVSGAASGFAAATGVVERTEGEQQVRLTLKYVPLEFVLSHLNRFAKNANGEGGAPVFPVELNVRKATTVSGAQLLCGCGGFILLVLIVSK
jgi:hypothetical protein